MEKLRAVPFQAVALCVGGDPVEIARLRDCLADRLVELFQCPGSSALNALARIGPDLILVDACIARSMLPDLKNASPAPVLVIDALDSDPDGADLIEGGADDVVRMTVGNAELVARVVALLRRREDLICPLRVGSLEIDRRGYRATVDGEILDLTPTEFRLLEVLARHQERVAFHQDLVDRVYGHSIGKSTLAMAVNRLRHKLRAANGPLLEVVPGVGYRLRSAADARRATS